MAALKLSENKIRILKTIGENNFYFGILKGRNWVVTNPAHWVGGLTQQLGNLCNPNFNFS
jgi:hypothetical protein